MLSRRHFLHLLALLPALIVVRPQQGCTASPADKPGILRLPFTLPLRSPARPSAAKIIRFEGK